MSLQLAEHRLTAPERAGPTGCYTSGPCSSSSNRHAMQSSRIIVLIVCWQHQPETGQVGLEVGGRVLGGAGAAVGRRA